MTDGKISVRMDSGKDDRRFDPNEMRHFDHGYAVTSHSSQGLTSERVLVNMDTEVHPELINARFAYVSVSRASHDAQIFTNDAANLAESLSEMCRKLRPLILGSNIYRYRPLCPQLASFKSNTTGNGLGLGLR